TATVVTPTRPRATRRWNSIRASLTTCSRVSPSNVAAFTKRLRRVSGPRRAGSNGSMPHHRITFSDMDPLATMERVVGESERVVHGVGPDQLDSPTLCTEWTVRDIINHITGGAMYFAMVAEQGSVPDEVMEKLLGAGDNLGDDYKGAFDEAARRFRAAFRQPGVLEKTVKLPFGEVPAAMAVNIGIFDVSTHTCDIAEPTGQQMPDLE